MVAASRIVAVAQIIPSYSPGGADVYPIGYIVRLAYASLLPCQTTFRSVYPFLQDSLLCPTTDTRTHIPR